MKTCPKCNRTFPDEGQKFCTFDGGLLIAPQNFDPNATMRATSIDLNAASERPTSRDLPDQNATIIENYPATVALPRNTGPTGQTTTVSGPDTADFSKPAPPPPPPAYVPPATPAPPPTPAETSSSVTGPVAPTVAASAAPAQAPSAPLPQPAAAQKKSKLPWIIAGVLLFLLLGGGALAAAFFLVVKPRLDEMAAERGGNENRRVIATNTNTATPEPTIEQPSPTPDDTFVPPPNAVQFTNSNEGLEGALAEHYFDFSFYYPQTWERIRKPSAANFVEVERRIPPNLTQESFVVSWYTSKGTFVADLPSYKDRVEELSTRLSTQFPEYRKVSEGPTKLNENKMDGYEFRWQGLSRGTERGDVHLWGRVIFVPTGNEGDTTGATLILFTTSLAPELSSVEDVGTEGQARVILDSFRFGNKQ
jgi:hypothetical protein